MSRHISRESHDVQSRRLYLLRLSFYRRSPPEVYSRCWLSIPLLHATSVLKATLVAQRARHIPYLVVIYFASSKSHMLFAPFSQIILKIFRCLQSLRQHICPLCRSPFEASDIRRLHVDCTDSHLNARRAPSPRRTNEPRIELPAHNALGLVEEIPRAVQLQRKISDLVLKSSLSSAVRERGLRELIQEVHAFLGSEPLEWVRTITSPLIALHR